MRGRAMGVWVGGRVVACVVAGGADWTLSERMHEGDGGASMRGERCIYIIYMYNIWAGEWLHVLCGWRGGMGEGGVHGVSFFPPTDWLRRRRFASSLVSRLPPPPAAPADAWHEDAIFGASDAGPEARLLARDVDAESSSRMKA